MTATYIHTKRKPGITSFLLRVLAVLYFAALAASIVYLWHFTHDRFITTAAFKISRQSTSGVETGMVQLALPGLSDSGSMDAQIAIGYITSSDLLLTLEKEFDLVGHYSAPQRDVVFRLRPEWPLEERLAYYRKRITAHFDMTTGLTTVKVEAFDPNLSHRITQEILKRSEAFINELNQQIADQQMAFVREEVDRAAARVEEINRELIKLQNEHRLINPDEVISSSIAALRELQMEHLRIDAELASILRDSPESPKIEPLRSRLRSLQELINVETAKLSGTERDRMNQILIQFKELQLRLDFAIRLRTGAETMLEKNRVDAAARSRFFSVIQNPFVPEDVGQPRRWYATFTIIALGLLLFLILRALTHSAVDRD